MLWKRIQASQLFGKSRKQPVQIGPGVDVSMRALPRKKEFCRINSMIEGKTEDIKRSRLG